MIEENQLTSFVASTLPGKKWLIFSPHADDESVGMGGTIIDAIARGIEIELVVMINGVHGKIQQKDRTEIISTREQEVKKVAAFLGIKAVFFMAEKDRSLSLNKHSLENISEQLNASLADTVFIPSSLETHPDHRMTSELVWQAIKKVNFSGHVFSYDISIQSPLSHLVDISHTYAKKRSAIALYHSQTKQNNYIEMALALNKARSCTLAENIEYAEAFREFFPKLFDSFSIATFKSLQAYWQTLPVHNLSSRDKLIVKRQQQKIAVIIVNYNSGDLLLKSVHALEKQCFIPDKVIIVDNASSDNSLNGLESSTLNLEIINVDYNSGFAKANNIALDSIDAAEYDYVALLNPDAFPSENWLSELLSGAIENPHYSFFASNMLDANNHQIIDGQGDVYHFSGLAWRYKHGSSYNKHNTSTDEPYEIFSACAGAALYRTEDIKLINGFDEDFFCYMEDIDLCFRLLNRGKKGLYLPKAIIHHVGSAITGKKSEFSVYYGHRNLVWTYFKNMPLLLLMLTLPAHFLLNIVTIIHFSLKGQARNIIRSKHDALKGLAVIFKKRAELQMENKVSSRYLFSLLNKKIFF